MNSLTAAMRVLELLSPNRRVLRVSEVSRDLEMQKSSVSRLLRQMSDHEMLEPQPDGPGYIAGRRTLVLANLYLSAHLLLDRVNASVDKLVEEFGFVGFTCALSGPDGVFLRVHAGRYPLRFTSDVGERFPVLTAAAGIALLALKSDEEVFSILTKGDIPFDRASVANLLESTRSDGIVCTNNAVIPGISAIGTAVKEPGIGQALGFSIAYPGEAADENVRMQMARRIAEERDRIILRNAKES